MNPGRPLSTFLGPRFKDHEAQDTHHTLSARLRQLCVSALSLFRSLPFNFQLSTVNLSPSLLPRNFYPPASDLRHNPAAQGQHPQINPQTGRIQ